MGIIEAQTRAREISSQYNPEGLVPFPFQALVDKTEGLTLYYLAGMSDKISGAIFLQNEAFIIAINSSKPLVRQNFTAAHELGHYFLHREWLEANPQTGVVDYSDALDGESMLLRPDEQPTDQETLQREREANNFAAELLMPEDKVREFWELTHDVNNCADAFQVSVAAMAIRLERLRLV